MLENFTINMENLSVGY